MRRALEKLREALQFQWINVREIDETPCIEVPGGIADTRQRQATRTARDPGANGEMRRQQ